MSSISQLLENQGGLAIASAAVLATATAVWWKNRSAPRITLPKGRQIVEVRREAEKGESAVYRNAAFKDELVERLEGLGTIWDLIVDAVQRYGDRPYLGTRKKNPDGSRGAFEWITYKQYMEFVTYTSSGLMSLGAKPKDIVGIFSSNCMEWKYIEGSCYANSLVLVSLYETLGPGAVEYIVGHAETKIIFCSATSYDKLITACSNLKENPVKHIIVIGGVPENGKGKANALGINAHSLSDIMEKGKANPLPFNPPQPEDLCSIMYTSGTTGLPKGVMLSHKNCISVLGALKTLSAHIGKDFTDEVVALSYLPLAHIMERQAQNSTTHRGGKIGFFSGDIKKLLEDFHALKPTAVVGAPRVYQRMYDRVMGTIEESGALRKRFFEWAYEYKKRAISRGETTPLLDKLVFSKLNEKIFGGNIRQVVSGSAPLSSKVFDFLKICIAYEVQEGYGLTETTAGCCMQDPRDIHPGRVGPPSPSVEIKLVDVPELNYFTSDAIPKGELWIRGPPVTSGYYKEPEKTREAFEKGWFKSGDIARINEDGTVSIIDRRKNIFKLSVGEYIAPEYLENINCRSRFVAQCFVYGSSLQPSLVAVIIPDEETVMKWAKEKQIAGDFKTLVRDKRLKEVIMADIARVGREAKILPYEFVKDIHLDHELWSLDNNILTPTLKLKRPECLQRFQKEVDEMYARLEALDSQATKQQQ